LFQAHEKTAEKRLYASDVSDIEHESFKTKPNKTLPIHFKPPAAGIIISNLINN